MNAQATLSLLTGRSPDADGVLGAGGVVAGVVVANVVLAARPAPHAGASARAARPHRTAARPRHTTARPRHTAARPRRAAAHAPAAVRARAHARAPLCPHNTHKLQ